MGGATDTRARAYRSGTQTNSISGWQKVQLNTESFDFGGNFDPETNYRFTAPVPGTYLVIGKIQFSAITACRFNVAIRKNGSLASRLVDQPLAASKPYGLGGSDEIELAADDYIELWYYTDQADGQIEGGGGYDTFLDVHLLSI
jgi:hypothetical protein